MNELFEKYSSLSPQNKVTLAVGLVLGFALIYYLLYFQDMETEYKRMNYRQNSAVNEFSEKYIQASNVKNLNKYIQNLNSKLDKAVLLLPETGDISKLLRDLAVLAKKYQIYIDKFFPKEEVLKDFYVEVPIEIIVRGSYHNIALFIQEMNRLPRIVNIFNLSLKNPVRSNETNEIELTGQLLAKTYHSGVEKVKQKKAKMKEKNK